MTEHERLDLLIAVDETSMDQRPDEKDQRPDEKSDPARVARDLDVLDGPPEARVSQRSMVIRRFMRRRTAVASLGFLILLTVVSMFADLIAPHELNPSFTPELLLNSRQPPSGDHLFGTDELGRDQFTRVLHAARISLTTAFVVAIGSSMIGTAFGALSGYFGGWVDQVLMRSTDLFLIVPTLAILMMAQQRLGATPVVITVVLSMIFWQTIARVIRGVFLSLREREFVEAAKASGASDWHIITRHMLPNAVGPIIVNVTLVIGYAILIESTLSFLGFGIQPPSVSWGNMIASSKDSIGTPSAHLVYFPAGALLLTVLAVNVIGEALRDAFDPQAERR